MACQLLSISLGFRVQRLSLTLSKKHGPPTPVSKDGNLCGPPLGLHVRLGEGNSPSRHKPAKP